MNTYNYEPATVLEEVKHLISYSISNIEEQNSNYKTMHRAIIKKYFEAKNVHINYQEHTVEMEIPVGNRKYTRITFECQKLERFLKSCLKKDEKSLYFYQNILTHYNAVSAA
ncbi:hypothetical protein [Salegentibacter chungangensis]|uniref:Uncharacterized protein n=1 Tax=Salegentibacter chungangensis TaxID=1335724 RepID=A0ABW3NM40_9FLAO